MEPQRAGLRDVSVSRSSPSPIRCRRICGRVARTFAIASSSVSSPFCGLKRATQMQVGSCSTGRAFDGLNMDEQRRTEPRQNKKKKNRRIA